MEHDIILIEVNGEKVYLKKGYFSHRVVHPPKDENGKIIWINLLIGGWGHFFKLLFILAVIFSTMYFYYHDTHEMEKITANPCEYCSTDAMQDMLNQRMAERENISQQHATNLYDIYNNEKDK